MSPASKEELDAVTAAVAKGISDSQPPHKVILDAQGNDPVQDKKPWWKSNVPAWVTGGLLGSVLGLGIAWGGMQAARAEQDKEIVDIKVAAEKREERLRTAETAVATLGAANSAQHGALSSGVADVKKDTADVKKEVAEVKSDVADVRRDVKALSEKLDAIYKAVKKL